MHMVSTGAVFTSRLRFRLTVTVFCLAFLLAPAATPAAPSQTTYEIYASGLLNPKGLAFGADGLLYVAESGRPGKVFVPLPAAYGDAPLGDSGRISVIRDGQRHDYLVGLPNMGLYGGQEMLGPSGLARRGDALFYVPALHMTEAPKLYRMDAGGVQVHAEVGEFNLAHPPPPSNGDAAIGNPYDMVAVGDDFFITDGNFNRVLKVDGNGGIEIFAAYEYSPVTTGIAADADGYLYVAQFSPAPYMQGSSSIDRISPAGEIEAGFIGNLTNAIDVAFAPDGTLYVLEFANRFDPGKLIYRPYGGRVLRILADGSHEPVLTNLMFPTAMIFGDDGALYVSNFGHQANDKQGQILKVWPGDLPAAAPMVAEVSGERWEEQPASPVVSAAFEETADDAVVIRIIEGPDVMKWGYDPASLSVFSGTDVLFINVGAVPHTATSTEGSFDTALLKHNERASITLSEIGDYSYSCTPHPWMKGSISVSGAGGDGVVTMLSEAAAATTALPSRQERLGFAGTSPVHIAILLGGVFALLFSITRVFAKK